MVVFLLLKIDGDVLEYSKSVEAKLKLEDTIGLQHLKGVIENKGKGKIQRLHVWEVDDYKIHAYGWKKGDRQNTHTIPKPLDEVQLYGDVVLFKTVDDTFINIYEADYLEFYQNQAWENEYETASESDSEYSSDELEEDEDNFENDLPEIVPEQVIDELQLEPEYVPK